MPDWLAVACVLCIAAGQILVKLAADAATRAGSLVSMPALAWLGVALAVYAGATLGWVWLLQRSDLGRIYPFMALAFVMVPIGSHFVFGERFAASYMVGVALIVLGLVLVVRS